MAIVRTQLIPIGTHQSPDGTVRATPERVRRWAESFQRLKADGIKFPVCWGHQDSARPGNQSFLSSRYNAGYILDLESRPEGLSAVIDAPGLDHRDGQLVSVATVNGVPVQTAISEISGAIGPWTDGRGRRHADIINHIALTPLPVVAGQKGFQALATEPDEAVGYTGASVPLPAFRPLPPLLCLSTQTLATVAPMKKASDKDADGVPDVLDDDVSEDVSDEDFDDVSDELSDPEGDDIPTPAAEAIPVQNPDADLIARAKGALANAGLDLPDLGGEPDLQQFVEHLVVAVTALNSQAAMAQANANNATNNNPPAQRPAEQTPPVMMSTLTPDAQRLAGQMEKAQQRKRLRRIDRLVERGLRPARAESMRTLATRQRLSLVPVGEEFRAAKGEIDRQLDVLEENLPALSPQLQRLGAQVHTNPIEQTGEVEERAGIPVTKEQAAAVDRMLEASGQKPEPPKAG